MFASDNYVTKQQRTTNIAVALKNSRSTMTITAASFQFQMSESSLMRPIEGVIVRKNSSTPAAFLEKLYDILDDVSLESYISWQPDGQSFLIRDVNSVSELVLPHYFKHNNIQSFVRQLNMYSFTKTRHDSNYREFRQPLFQRGRRDLLALIKRKTQGSSEKNGVQKRKFIMLENETEFKCVSSATDEESEDKLSSDGGDDDIGEEVSSASNCSSDNEMYNGALVRDTELEEIKSHMTSIQSQMWSLNERYCSLSANYNTLRDKFERYQSKCTKSPRLSSLGNSTAPSIAEPGAAIVRMISFDSQRQSEFRSSGPMSALLHQTSTTLVGPVSSNRLIVEQFIKPSLDSYPKSQGISRQASITLESDLRTTRDLGLGLDAIVAAATLMREKPTQDRLPNTTRSSLADLLDAAYSSVPDTHQHSSPQGMKVQ